MSDADKAFAAAQAEIARVAEAGEDTLDLNDAAYHALTTLPEEIGSLDRVTWITLDGTQITDLTPLAPLTGLEQLALTSTTVTDIAPIQSLTGLTELYLSDTQVTDIAPLQALIGLRFIDLSRTQVTDIAPLQAVKRLKRLGLSNTQITDIAPLGDLRALQALSINDSKVADLRPLIPLVKLGEGGGAGLWYENTPASRANPTLARLSQVEDHNYAKCYRDTREYLLTLPPYPEPLPWDVPDSAADTRTEAPEQAPMPRLVLGPDERIDLDDLPPDQSDLDDPIKARLYAKLPDAAERLWRAGNQFPQVSGAADALRTLCSVPFAEADLYEIHLALAELTDVRNLNPSQPEKEQLDADCMAALNTVLRVGPPVTMGNELVELHEKRLADYAQQRPPATVAEAERLIALGITEASDIATEKVRDLADRLAVATPEGRVAGMRRSFVQNALIALGTVTGAMVDAAVGYVPGTVVGYAMEFLWLHKDAVVAMSAAWGETGIAWVEYMLAKIKRAMDKAKG